MQQAQPQPPSLLASFPLEHEDFVHDVSYDFYGKRMATCSSDQKIRIWEKYPTNLSGGASSNMGMQDQNDYQEEWKMTEILGGSNNGHAGAVWKAKWADPEYGQIIASCGYDKQFIIWEETENKDNNSKKQWSKRYLNLCRDNVKDIKFAPRPMGLQLAVALENGNVIIYEAKDLNNLTSWTEIFDIKTNSTGCNCLSWNPAFDELPMIVVGCNDYFTQQAIGGGQSMIMGASSAGVGGQQQQREQQEIMEESLLQIFIKKDTMTNYQLLSRFKGGHTATVNDVAWAPLAGRSFHMIASCSKDKTIIVWKVVTKNVLSGAGQMLDPIQIEQLSKLDQHQSEVWRVSWNLLGTILASSGDDGTVRIWKKSLKNKFNSVAVLQSKNVGAV